MRITWAERRCVLESEGRVILVLSSWWHSSLWQQPEQGRVMVMPETGRGLPNLSKSLYLTLTLSTCICDTIYLGSQRILNIYLPPWSPGQLVASQRVWENSQPESGDSLLMWTHAHQTLIFLQYLPWRDWCSDAACVLISGAGPGGHNARCRLAPAKCLHSETFTWSNNNHFSRLGAEHRWDYPPLALFPSAAGGAQGRVFRGDILCMCLTCVQQYLEVWPILGRSRYNQAKWSNQSKNGHKNWHILLVPMD